VKSFFEEAYNNKKYDIIKELFTEDYFDHSPANARSCEDAIGIVKIVHGIFQDIKVEILDSIEEGNKVVVRARFIGTHKGEYLGIEASNKTIEWEAIEIFLIENEKISESWGYWPDLEILNKLKN
jgi:steroid delta-isomerase-like uncharacterized protein